MKKILKSFMCVSIFLFALIIIQPLKASALGNVQVDYRVHVSEIGWMDTVSNGTIAGTTGKSLGIEAISISSPNTDFTIQYRVHVSELGYLPMNNEGEIAGTTGRRLPIEAIAIFLKDANGNDVKDYNIKYRVHVQDDGWHPWVQNGANTGTTGQAKRIEAIQIYIEKTTKGQEIVNYAKTFLGTPYLWGGTTPAGFDCSGFTQYVYKHFGIDITRTTYTQINVGAAVSQSSLQLGDLVFTSSGHVGIYVGNNQIIHSPKTGDVIKISTIWSFYAARRIL